MPQLHLMACANHEVRCSPLRCLRRFCIGGPAPHVVCLPFMHSILPKRGRSTKDCSALLTCQVRVVRFYVSLFSSSSRTPPPPPSSSSSCRDPVSSVWRAGPQPRAREFSVACRTPTAILRVQCGVPDPNRDPASSAWRPGPQVL